MNKKNSYNICLLYTDRFLVVTEIIEMPMLLISRIFCRETQTSYNMKWL